MKIAPRGNDDMRAIILAAGCGSRISSLTSGRPKCLLELHGQPILFHQLDLLDACGVTEVTIVTGFAAEHVRARAKGRASCVHYPDFASTNNLLTLHHCRHLLKGDVLLLFSDVLVSRDSLRAGVEHPADFALLIDTSPCLEGTMRVRVGGGLITDIGPHIPVAEGHGNFIGVAKYSAQGSKLLAAELARLATTGEYAGAYYTAALASLAASGTRIEGVSLGGSPWIEIDTAEDYRAAQGSSFYLTDAGAAERDEGRGR